MACSLFVTSFQHKGELGPRPRPSRGPMLLRARAQALKGPRARVRALQGQGGLEGPRGILKRPQCLKGPGGS